MATTKLHMVTDITLAAERAQRETLSPREATRLSGVVQQLLAGALAVIATHLEDVPTGAAAAEPTMQGRQKRLERALALLAARHRETAWRMCDVFQEATRSVMTAEVADGTIRSAHALADTLATE
jgi:hypothetical protein